MSKIQKFLKSQEKSVMSTVEGKTIIDYFNNNAEEVPEYPALNTPINLEYTGWDSLSWSAYRETVHNLASGLIDIGLQAEDNAFIVANNVKEHFICDLGIMHAGAVPSTIYKQLKSGQIEYISNLLEAKVVFVGDAELFEEVNKAKENCPDMRNTKVIDTVISINKFNIKSTIVDPWVNKEEVKEKYHLDVLNEIPLGIKYNAILLAVAHDDFRELDNNSWGALLEEGGILFDLKGIIPRNLNPKRL